MILAIIQLTRSTMMVMLLLDMSLKQVFALLLVRQNISVQHQINNFMFLTLYIKIIGIIIANLLLEHLD